MNLRHKSLMVNREANTVASAICSRKLPELNELARKAGVPAVKIDEPSEAVVQ